MSNESNITGFNEFAGRQPEALEPTPNDLEVDTLKYRAALGESDLAEEQIEEFLHTLFDIIRSFVELGVSTEICGQIFDEIIEGTDEDDPDAIIVPSSKTEKRSPPSGKETL